MYGVLQEVSLPVGMILYHGCDSGTFEARDIGGPAPMHIDHTRTPEPPAWFARNYLFSLHAAIRDVKANTPAMLSLHRYEVRRSIDIWMLEDLGELQVFMQKRFGHTAIENSVLEAAKIALEGGPIDADGFGLRRDAVRNEPEYVLFEAGMSPKKLRRLEPWSIKVVPRNPPTKPPISDLFSGDNYDVLLAMYT